MHVRVITSTRPDKKLMAIAYKEPKKGAGYERKVKTVHFGQRGTGDYTTHKDEGRKRSYLARHGATEDWGKSGMLTAGFLAKNVLWNKPTLRESIDDLNKRYKGANFGLVMGTKVPKPKSPKPPKPPKKPPSSDMPPARLRRKTDYRDTKYGPPR